jgi:hypothetical protein
MKLGFSEFPGAKLDVAAGVVLVSPDVPGVAVEHPPSTSRSPASAATQTAHRTL